MSASKNGLLRLDIELEGVEAACERLGEKIEEEKKKSRYERILEGIKDDDREGVRGEGDDI